MPEPEPIWVKSRWTAEELHGHTIEFQLILKQGEIGAGTGKLLAQSRKLVDDLIAVRILVDEAKGAWRRHQLIIPLPQACVDRIEIHPKEHIARFRVAVG